MRTRPATPTEEEVALHRRLRLASAFFNNLNTTIAGRADLQVELKTEERNFLPAAVVTAIEQYRAEASLSDADLMAMRNCPGKWCRHDPYRWLWILHRYQNRYSK